MRDMQEEREMRDVRDMRERREKSKAFIALITLLGYIVVASVALWSLPAPRKARKYILQIFFLVNTLFSSCRPPVFAQEGKSFLDRPEADSGAGPLSSPA